MEIFRRHVNLKSVAIPNFIEILSDLRVLKALFKDSQIQSSSQSRRLYQQCVGEV